MGQMQMAVITGGAPQGGQLGVPGHKMGLDRCIVSAKGQQIFVYPAPQMFTILRFWGVPQQEIPWGILLFVEVSILRSIQRRIFLP